MADRYDFANLSPVEFESLCIDLLAADTGLRFERFAEGADAGVDGRHSRADGDIILQVKHYKGSTWGDLQSVARKEAAKLAVLKPVEYYFLTSQPLTVGRKKVLASLLDHPSVAAARILGRTELNALLTEHSDVEKRNIKLWLSSAAVLERLLTNDIAVYTGANAADIERILNVYVANPSLPASIRILDERHCLIISGPPGVGKTTLAQVISADYGAEGWQLVSMASIDDGFRSFNATRKQVFVFDDFLGTIKLDRGELSRQDSRIVSFMGMIHRDKNKRFILTTRAYIWQAALILSETLDDGKVAMAEMVLDLDAYSRELKARILYNHLYHSAISRDSIEALLAGDTIRRVVDHRNYMPRIVQWMTDEIRQRDVRPEEYPSLFLNTLDRPDKIWEKAFRQHISENARVLLYCMYFSETPAWNTRGISLDGLRTFFERSMYRFGIVSEEGYRGTMFADAVRELKSSFIVMDEGTVNFINPSVQDFLSVEAMDPNVIRTVATAVPRWSTAMSLWKAVKASASAPGKSKVAQGLLRPIASNDLDGRLGLHDLVRLIGDLILITDAAEVCRTLRRSSRENAYWINEAELPSLIEDLSDGPYRHLPHARSFGRYLRLQLFLAVTGNVHALELDDLAVLAKSLTSSSLEMPKAFVEHFDDAAYGAIDALNVDTIPEDSDPSQVIEEWLEQIQAIDLYSSSPASYPKKRELEERLGQISWAEEWRDRDEVPISVERSRSSGEVTGTFKGFSDSDLGAMFSSLKRSR